jgi:hypothetical protein
MSIENDLRPTAVRAHRPARRPGLRRALLLAATVAALGVATAAPAAATPAGPIEAGTVCIPEQRIIFTVWCGGPTYEVFRSQTPLWSSRTAGHPGARALMQADGNLVVYTRSGRPVWSTRTGGKPPGSNYNLNVQTDGNLVVYHGHTPLWGRNNGRL